MITIKNDIKLIEFASLVNIDPQELTNKIEKALHLSDEDDPYAGETLGAYLDDYSFYTGLFLDDLGLPHTMKFNLALALVSLKLYYKGADNPCPECGWEKSENTNDYLWHCPHCGWSEMIFLSEQNED